MSVEHIGKGYVKICVSEEELEKLWLWGLPFSA